MKKTNDYYLQNIGNISYEEFKDIQKRTPDVSFEEMSRAGAYLLLRQRPVTIEQARAQIMYMHARSPNANSEYEIKRHLRMYSLYAPQEEIDKDCREITHIISKEHKVINIYREIARYLERKRGIPERDSKIIEEDYSVYFSQGKLLYIWNFWRGDFDRIKNSDFDSTDNLVIESEWLSDKTSAEKIVEEKSKLPAHNKGRVYISKQEMSKDSKTQLQIGVEIEK